MIVLFQTGLTDGRICYLHYRPFVNGLHGSLSSACSVCLPASKSIQFVQLHRRFSLHCLMTDIGYPTESLTHHIFDHYLVLVRRQVAGRSCRSSSLLFFISFIVPQPTINTTTSMFIQYWHPVGLLLLKREALGRSLQSTSTVVLRACRVHCSETVRVDVRVIGPTS